MTTKQIGDWGEKQVACWLRERGYSILAQGYRCRFGEIDLIAQKGDTLCFVEVKLRSNGQYGRPMDYVGYAKQQRLRTTAELYLSTHDPDAKARFDVAEVFCDRDHKQARIAYHENAF